MAKLTPRQTAQQLALRGDIDAALEQLALVQRKHEAFASAALAEIAAYRADWAEVLHRVEVVVSKPDSVRTLNVFRDLMMLAARAGAETGAWAHVLRLADIARQDPSVPESPAKARAVVKLADFALRQGDGPFEASEPEGPAREKFESGLVAAQEMKFANNEARLDHLFGLARVYEYYPGAVALFDRERDLPDIFDNVVFLASGLVRVGRNDEAWESIRTQLDMWWPVEESQIAPVALLTDVAIRDIMTSSRCEEILRTPRGGEVWK
jgi:hypothetical protein